nr:putative ribonuclease H-like domain-containing protein [Tanacetum cinerariifolium]
MLYSFMEIVGLRLATTTDKICKISSREFLTNWVSVPQTTQENGVSVTKLSVPVTAEEKINKKNDMKARSLLLMALPNEHQLTFIWMNKADIETMNIDDLYKNFKIVEKDEKKSIGTSTGAQNMAFMTAPSTSSTNDVNTANPAYDYLEQIHEDDLEAMDLSEEVAVLKREVACKDYEINVLKSKFEKVKQEKKGIEFKIKKFDNASKSLDKLIGNQITDNSKKGLGYHVVPPPHPLIYNGPTKLDLSYSGLMNSKNLNLKVMVLRIGNPQKDDKGFTNSGCLRHMTGNIAYLSDFKEFDGGYIAFGGGARGGRIFGKASKPDIIFAVCACARFQVTPKTSHLLVVKRIFRYLKGKLTLGLWYPRDSPFELVDYTDSDYDGATQHRKSTTGGCQFWGNRLISWQCKKQTVVATSTTEAEYVTAASCCGQVLWIQNQLLDYGYNFMNIEIHINNTSTICIIENPVQHSKTEHIKIRHHFIRDCNTKKLILMVKIHVDYNVADLLTKGFDARRISTVRVSVNTASVKLRLVGDEAVHKELGDRMERVATTASNLEAEQDSGPLLQNDPTILPPPILSPSRKMESLEFDFKQIKLTYASAYTKLIVKVKKLENKVKLRKVRRRVRLIVLENEDDLEDPSKQGRKIAQIDKDEGITLVQMDISTANVPVTTAGAEINTASPEDKTVKTFDDSDDITLAETLIEIRRKSSKKRQREVSDKESSKKQKLEEDNIAEKEELRAILDIVLRDDITINVESLATKYPIVDWKTYILKENMIYYQIIRVDGSFKNYKIFSEMLDDFDR